MDAAPSTTSIEEALTRISPRDKARAALHLALPDSEVLDFAVTTSGGTWTWRGVSVESGPDPVGAAALLAQLGAREEDRYLDLSSEPTGWVKVVRSGARHFAFGADVLLGAPSISAEASVPSSAHALALQAWVAGASAPLALDVDGVSVLVDGDEESWVLRAQAKPATEVAQARPGDADAMSAWLAAELGGRVRGVVVLGERDAGTETEHHFELDGWSVVVPVLVTPTSEVVGEPTHDLLSAGGAVCPQGWTPRGWSPWNDVLVAEHLASGVLARLRPA